MRFGTICILRAGAVLLRPQFGRELLTNLTARNTGHKSDCWRFLWPGVEFPLWSVSYSFQLPMATSATLYAGKLAARNVYPLGRPPKEFKRGKGCLGGVMQVHVGEDYVKSWIDKHIIKNTKHLLYGPNFYSFVTSFIKYQFHAEHGKIFDFSRVLRERFTFMFYFYFIFTL